MKPVLSSKELQLVITHSQRVIEELIRITKPLATERPVGNSNFLRVFEAAYRRAYHGLQAVYFLSHEPHLGSQALIISRSLLEDLISIEYMIATDKEVKAKAFRDFYWIQSLQDHEYIKSQGLDVDPQVKASLAEVQKEAKKVEGQFLHDKKRGILRKSWDGKSVDQILEIFLSSPPEEFAEKEVRTVAWDYLQACRKTHFNPIDLTLYLDEQALRADYAHTMASALLMTAGCFVRLTTRFRDEVSHSAGKNLYDGIAHRANELLFADPILNPVKP